MIGTYVLSAGYYDAYYLKALKVRKLISQDFEDSFQKCDLILTPTTPNVAFAIGEKQTNPIEMYLNDVLTVPASLAGLPAISVPSGFNSEKLPIRWLGSAKLTLGCTCFVQGGSKVRERVRFLKIFSKL